MISRGFNCLIFEPPLFFVAPGRPLGLRASYLSHSELEVTWKPPDNPNGIIIEYRIYFERKNYSFWKSGLDWCSRDVTPFSAKRIEETQETTSTVVDNGEYKGE